MALDNLKNTLVTVDAMKMANKELKGQYKKVNLDKIEVFEVPLMQGGIVT